MNENRTKKSTRIKMTKWWNYKNDKNGKKKDKKLLFPSFSRAKEETEICVIRQTPIIVFFAKMVNK